MRCQNFLKVHKNTGEKYLSADGCFVKTNTINCDDNDDAICFLNIRAFTFTRQPMKENFTWSTRAIHLCNNSAIVCQLKFWFAKIWGSTCVLPRQIYELLQIPRPCKNSRCFQKVVQLFNLMRYYFPIRDSKRLECVRKCF